MNIIELQKELEAGAVAYLPDWNVGIVYNKNREYPGFDTISLVDGHKLHTHTSLTSEQIFNTDWQIYG